MIVIDASALADFLLGGPEALDGLVDELAHREHEPLHAPELVEPETYLALAEALGDAILVTSDIGLAERGRSSLGGDRVLHVG